MLLVVSLNAFEMFKPKKRCFVLSSGKQGYDLPKIRSMSKHFGNGSACSECLRPFSDCIKAYSIHCLKSEDGEKHQPPSTTRVSIRSLNIAKYLRG